MHHERSALRSRETNANAMHTKYTPTTAEMDSCIVLALYINYKLKPDWYND